MVALDGQGGPGCDERGWDVAAVELAGDGGEGFPRRLLALGASRGWSEAACVVGQARGALLIVRLGWFAAAVDRIVGDRRSVVDRAPWQRWALADELVDELGLFHERAGALAWLGRRRPGQRLSGRWRRLAVAAL